MTESTGEGEDCIDARQQHCPPIADGGVAETVGRLLQRIGAKRQVLCVTHLPQVAACADRHFAVRKAEAGKQVRSTVEALAAKDRVEEVARMLGGVEITARTRAHAREMLAASGRD